MLKSCKITLKNHPPAYPQHSSRLEQMSITRLLHSLIQRERETSDPSVQDGAGVGHEAES